MTKDSYVKSYASFVDEVGKEHDNYSEKDWETKDEEFKQYVSEYYKEFEEDLTTEEKAELVKLAFKYNYYQYEKGVKDLEEIMESEDMKELEKTIEVLAKEGVQVMEELEPEFRKFGKKFVREFGDDIGDLLDKVGEGIDKLKEEVLEEQKRLRKELNKDGE